MNDSKEKNVNSVTLGSTDLEQINVDEIEFHWEKKGGKGIRASNHSAIYVESVGGGHKEGGGGIVLNVGRKRIGFKMAEFYWDHKIDYDEKTHTQTQYYDVFCCHIRNRGVSADGKPTDYVEQTNTYNFDSEKAQQCALNLFVKAMQMKSEMREWMIRDGINKSPREKVVKFTNRLSEKIKNGDYLT